MQSSKFISAFIYLFLLSINSQSAKAENHGALVAPIGKDPSTNLYHLTVQLTTPQKPTKLHLDLGNSLTWVDCNRRYKSSSYRHVLYNSSLCTQLDTGLGGNICYSSPRLNCFNGSCAYFAENWVTRNLNWGEVFIDSFSLALTDGQNPSGRLGFISDFVLTCTSTRLLKGLAKGVAGLASLGRYEFSLSSQISRALSNSSAVFAICLPSATANGSGVIIFNSRGPYYFLPGNGIDISRSLIYTPLLVNPSSTSLASRRGPSDEYFIGVTAIRVNGKAVPLNRTLLTINRDRNSFFYGFGGTKITTYTPYTLLHTSIYKAVTEAFGRESAAFNLTITKPVKPFGMCYVAESVGSTRVGPAVPTIDLVLQNDKVFWRIFGGNSIVRVKNDDGVDSWCLGVVDFGDGYNMNQPAEERVKRKTPIVIGGHQIEDNLLQIDIGLNRLGFSSSLLFGGSSCSSFNFTTTHNL